MSEKTDIYSTHDNNKSAEVGMTVTESVHTRNSSKILLEAGTILTPHILKTLALHGIRYVNIKESKDRVTVDDIWISSVITDSTDFIKFLADYNDVRSVIKYEMELSADGQQTNLDLVSREVFKLTQSIVRTSQVLNYLRYIKQGDDATWSHCLNVGILCCLFGIWLNWSRDTIGLLIISGIFHDIGKMQVPFDILYKPGRLTDDEFKEVKKHTLYGYKLLVDPNLPREVKNAALMHHEKQDGTGYPLGKCDKAINLYAAVVAICDVYEAMTADRVYRGRISPFEVLRKFNNGDFGELKRDYLYIFTRRIADAFLNCSVLLNDGREGTIFMINQNDLTLPVIICKDTRDVIDLSKETDIFISHVL